MREISKQYSLICLTKKLTKLGETWLVVWGGESLSAWLSQRLAVAYTDFMVFFLTSFRPISNVRFRSLFMYVLPG